MAIDFANQLSNNYIGRLMFSGKPRKGEKVAVKKTKVSVYGKAGTRGKRMSTGQGWRLVQVRGNKQFVGSLLKTVKVGDETIAIFRLRKYSN